MLLNRTIFNEPTWFLTSLWINHKNTHLYISMTKKTRTSMSKIGGRLCKICLINLRTPPKKWLSIRKIGRTDRVILKWLCRCTMTTKNGQKLFKSDAAIYFCLLSYTCLIIFFFIIIFNIILFFLTYKDLKMPYSKIKGWYSMILKINIIFNQSYWSADVFRFLTV